MEYKIGGYLDTISHAAGSIEQEEEVETLLSCVDELRVETNSKGGGLARLRRYYLS